MNLMPVLLLLLSKVNFLNSRTIWFIKIFSFLLRFHFLRKASRGSSFGSERNPATLILSVSQRSWFYHMDKKDAICLQVLLGIGSISD